MRSRAMLLAGAVSLVVVLAGCASPFAGASPTVTKTSTPSPSETCWKSPLTVLCSLKTTPVLIVKIDDVSGARPQRGLNSADVILVEPVEGGLTRLMAVFQSEDPVEVGPVRSARITDLDLAPAFGKPGFAYSGSTTKLRSYLEAANIQKVGAPQGGTGYFRVDTHDAPHNLMARTADLRARIDDVVAAQLNPNSSWAISEEPAGGLPTHQLIMRWPASEKTFTWDPALAQWLIRVYDTPLESQRYGSAQLERATTTTVFLMETHLQDNPIKFKRGAITPYPETIGEGHGWVLTNGHRVEATWKRPTEKGLPRWYQLNGKEISVKPGRVWWLIQTEPDEHEFRNYPPATTQKSAPSASASATNS
ncbi:MAG: putative lipoprotein YerB precursor [Actinomycetota bacterium]